MWIILTMICCWSNLSNITLFTDWQNWLWKISCCRGVTLSLRVGRGHLLRLRPRGWIRTILRRASWRACFFLLIHGWRRRGFSRVTWISIFSCVGLKIYPPLSSSSWSRAARREVHLFLDLCRSFVSWFRGRNVPVLLILRNSSLWIVLSLLSLLSPASFSSSLSSLLPLLRHISDLIWVLWWRNGNSKRRGVVPSGHLEFIILWSSALGLHFFWRPLALCCTIFAFCKGISSFGGLLFGRDRVLCLHLKPILIEYHLSPRFHLPKQC